MRLSKHICWIFVVSVAMTGWACGGGDSDSDSIVDRILPGGGGDNKTKDRPKDRPVVYKYTPTDVASGFALTLNNYDSCTDLQADVRAQLEMRRVNDAERDAYYKAEQEKWAREGGGDDGGGMVANDASSADFDSDDSAEIDSTGGAEDEGEAFTNTQEGGVDEADFVKVGRHHVFVAQNGRVQVNDRASLSHLGVIDLGELEKIKLFVHGDRLVVLAHELHTTEKCHMVYDNHYYWDEWDDYGLTSDIGWVGPGPGKPGEQEIVERCYDIERRSTLVRTYQGVAGAVPTLEGEQKFEQPYKEARFIEGRAVMLFQASLPMVSLDSVEARCDKNDWCYRDYYNSLRWRDYGSNWFYGYYNPYNNHYTDPSEPIPAEPIVVTDGKVAGVACNQIGKAYIKDLDFRMTIVASVNAANIAEAPKKVGTAGGGDTVYMSTQGLYYTKQGLAWTPWEPPVEAITTDEAAQQALELERWRKDRQLSETLVITKVAYQKETGDLAVTAVGAVNGWVKDQWALKEYGDTGTLAVATTTSAPLNLTEPEMSTKDEYDRWWNWEQHNHLWMLQQEGQTLKQVAAIQDFAPREDIRAVRFLGKMAYIVTFHKTDPLFSFDLSVPNAPKMLGELKIPGFSMYLHPVAPGRLVGVGYDADDQGDFAWFQGIQVSLFDTSDPTNMSRLDVKVHGHRGSYSDVTGDHKAFFYDSATALMALPMVEKESENGGSGSGQAQDVTFAGAVLYKVEDTVLTEVGRVSHEDLVPASCKDERSWHWWTDARRSLDINRVYRIDDRIVTVSRFGIKSFALDSFATATATTAFPAAEVPDCGTDNE